MRKSELQSQHRTRVLPAWLARQAAILFQKCRDELRAFGAPAEVGSYFEWSRRSLEVTARYGHVIS